MFKRSGTSIDPTLVEYNVFAHIGDARVTNDARLKYVSPELRAYWNRFFPADTAGNNCRNGGPARVPATLHGARLRDAQCRCTHPRRDRCRASYIYPGFSLHDELALLVEAGIPPEDVLKAATGGAASFLGVSDSVGTVQAGKLADLVIIDGNPLVDIRSTQSIRTVIVNGRVLDAAERRTILAATARDASAGKAGRK